MVTIEPYEKVNDITFSMDYEQVFQILGAPDRELAGPNKTFRRFWDDMEIEFEKNKIRSFAFNDLPELTIGAQIISFLDKTVFEKENPFYEDNTYTFPDWGITTYNIDNPTDGFEIRMFNSDFKRDFQDGEQKYPKFRDINSPAKTTIIKHDIKPKSGVGALKFGMSPEEVKSLLGAAKETLTIKGEPREKRNNIITTYNKANKLIQITYEDFPDVYLNGKNIAKTGDKDEAFKETELFINRSYNVYPELGLAFQNFGDKKGVKTIVVFNDEKIAFWKNKFMPLL